jgi:hypothetical protein
MSMLRGVVRRHIRSQTRIPASVEEVVRQSKGERAVERKHSAIFSIIDRRQSKNVESSAYAFDSARIQIPLGLRQPRAHSIQTT